MRTSDTPQPGFYLIRMIRGGPWVGAQIAHAEDGWTVMIDGVTEGPSLDPWSLAGMERVHWGGRETTEAEVKYRLALKQHAVAYEPDAPAANPKRAVNLDKLTPF